MIHLAVCMVSEANLRFLRSRDGQYIVGTPKAMLRQFEKHLAETDPATLWKRYIQLT